MHVEVKGQGQQRGQNLLDQESKTWPANHPWAKKGHPSAHSESDIQPLNELQISGSFPYGVDCKFYLCPSSFMLPWDFILIFPRMSKPLSDVWEAVWGCLVQLL